MFSFLSSLFEKPSKKVVFTRTTNTPVEEELSDAVKFDFTRRSFLTWSDQELESKWGDNWKIARGLIEERRQNIKDGYSTDWDKYADVWATQQPTDIQMSVIEANGFVCWNGMTKLQASRMIDTIVLDDKIKRDAAALKHKAMREAEKERKRLEREEARLKKVKNFKKEKLEELRHEFELMWNGVLADDVLEVGELVSMKKFLMKNRRWTDDHKQMTTLIDKVCEDGVVTQEEALELFNAALQVVEDLKETNTMTLVHRC